MIMYLELPQIVRGTHSKSRIVAQAPISVERVYEEIISDPLKQLQCLEWVFRSDNVQGGRISSFSTIESEPLLKLMFYGYWKSRQRKTCTLTNSSF